jgi:hypothetical protein
MAKIVRERDRVGQILVGAEVLADTPGNLSHFQGVGQARPIVVAFVICENLRLVLETPKRLGVNDSVPIPLESSSVRAFFFGIHSPLGVL